MIPKLHEIRFCWAMYVPAKLVYEGNEITVTTNRIKLLAASHTDMLKRLKGTDAKIISNINSIRECTQ